MALLHDVHRFRCRYVLSAPCIEQPCRRVTDARADFGHPSWLERHHDVTKPPDHGYGWHVKPHVSHLHPDVRGDFGGLSSKILPTAQGGSKGLFGRGGSGLARHGQRSVEHGLNLSLPPMGSNREG